MEKSKLYFEGDVCSDSVLCLPYNKVLFEADSQFQHIRVLETSHWGKVLLLDGIIQLCDAFEATYHEMMVHIAAHMVPKFQRVLILGGGDGGCLREVLRYSDVVEVILCDIDPLVTKVSQEFFPKVAGSIPDKRTRLIHEDGLQFVANYSSQPFDLIIVDSTDEMDIGSRLHSQELFKILKTKLTKGGAITCYGDSPFSNGVFYQKQKIMLETCFTKVIPYFGFTPMYNSGCWGYFICFSDLNQNGVRPFYDHNWDSSNLKYYNSDIHNASFASPNFLLSGTTL